LTESVHITRCDGHEKPGFVMEAITQGMAPDIVSGGGDVADAPA
jgi:hypothetical protein